MKDQALLGDCLETLAKFEENSLDFCVTDPPYGISFMGKRWDYEVPKVEVWEALLRVLKPGAHAMIFGGTTTFHRLLVNVEDAGFQVRNTIPWVFAEGFPKNMDVGKAIDELQVTENTKKWDGYGTALKPSTELIALVRKPINEKNIAANVLKWGTGALNIDGSRIEGKRIETKKPITEVQNTGRWPSNILFDTFAAMELDRQSGHTKSSDALRNNKAYSGQSFGDQRENITKGHEDSGRASRFFKVIDPDTDGLFVFQAKASKAEKNEGCEKLEVRQEKGGGGTNNESAGRAYGSIKAKHRNFHPTVKPLGLIKYLVNLISFPGAWGIDIYAGSGTFAIACRELFLHWTILEQDPEYFQIIQGRLRQGYLIDQVK